MSCASVHMSCIILSETLFVQIWVCLTTLTYFNGIGIVSSPVSYRLVWGSPWCRQNKFQAQRPRIFRIAIFYPLLRFQDQPLAQVALSFRWWSLTIKKFQCPVGKRKFVFTFYGCVLAFESFWRLFLRLLSLANLLQNLQPVSLLITLSPHVVHSLSKCLSTCSIQTDEVLTRLYAVIGM